MILTRSTRLSQPQGPVEIAPEWGGRGVVYLPNVRSGIAQVAGTVGRFPTQQGISASYTAGAETKIERLNGSAPNGVTEFTQIVYLTPTAWGAVNDRGIFGNRNTTGITSFIQLIHQARDAAANGRYCYRLFYKPTSAAAEVSIRTSNDSAVDNVPSVLIASVKNGKLSIYHNGTLQGSAAVTTPSVAGQLDFQFGNYYDNSVVRRLSAQIHLGAFLPRGITDAEAFALSDNPWQLFRPVQRRVYFDMGAGGGSVVGNASGALVSIGLDSATATASGSTVIPATGTASLAAISLIASQSGAYGVGSASSALDSVGLTSANATASGGTSIPATGSGALVGISLASTQGLANGSALASAALDNVSLTPATGSASAGTSIPGNASASLASASITPASAQATAAATAAGPIVGMNLTPAQAQAASEAWASAQLAAIGLTAATGAANNLPNDFEPADQWRTLTIGRSTRIMVVRRDDRTLIVQRQNRVAKA